MTVRRLVLLLAAVLTNPHLRTVAQRAYKISSTACTLTGDASSCQVASVGDSALQVVFAAGAGTTLTLDMAVATTCSASNVHCPQFFIVTSDNTANNIKISKCSYFKQAVYGTHLLTYSFMNFGTEHPFYIQDDGGFSRGVVPPGVIRECICYCTHNCYL